MAHLYRATFRPTLPRALGMLALAVSLGIAAAVLLVKLGSWGQLPIAGPLARGLAVGLPLTWAVERLTVAHHRLVVAITVAGCLASWTTSLTLATRDHNRSLRGDAETLYQLGIASGRLSDEASQERSQALAGLGPRGVIAAWVDSGRSSVWGLAVQLVAFLVGLALTLAAALYYPTGAATEPVCSVCGAWLEEAPATSVAYRSGAIDALVAGDVTEACARIKPVDTREETRLSVARCPYHPGSVVVRARERFVESKSRAILERHRADVVLAASELSELEEALANSSGPTSAQASLSA